MVNNIDKNTTSSVEEEIAKIDAILAQRKKKEFDEKFELLVANQIELNKQYAEQLAEIEKIKQEIVKVNEKASKEEIPKITKRGGFDHFENPAEAIKLQDMLIDDEIDQKEFEKRVSKLKLKKGEEPIKFLPDGDEKEEINEEKEIVDKRKSKIKEESNDIPFVNKKDGKESKESNFGKRKKQILRTFFKAAIIIMGSFTAMGSSLYLGGRYNDKVNNAIKEYIDEDIANVTKLPPEQAFYTIKNGIEKKLNIGNYTHEEKTSKIQTEESTDAQNDPTQEIVKIEKVEKPIVEDYVIGESVGEYYNLETRPYIVNMNASSGYKITTYNNHDGQFNKDVLRPIKCEGILGALHSKFEVSKGPHLYDEKMLVLKDGHITVKNGDEVQEGEMIYQLNSVGFDKIDTVTQNGKIMVRVIYDKKNLNTSVLADKNNNYIGLGLQNKWKGKNSGPKFIPIEECTSYGVSRGGMVFVFSEDLKDQYMIGGSFQNIYDIYSKLQAKNPNKKYYFHLGDHGSYANSLFSKNGVISKEDQVRSSSRNSWGGNCFLLLQKNK